jgi:Na+-transporting NADH:ubiquinone oxidoreductase subunit NqrF
MASTQEPIIQTFLAGGAIVKGHAVKISANDGKTVIECTAATDKGCGIAQSDAASGAPVEVAVGGGAKCLAQTTVAIGDLLASHTDGTIKPTTTANDRVLGVAMQSAVVGDIFSANIHISNY